MRFTRLLRMGGHVNPPNPKFDNFREPYPTALQKNLSVGIGAIMWFWVFYKAKQDLPVLLGFRLPWEGHDHGDHGDHHEEVHH